PLIDQVLAIVTLPVGNAGTGKGGGETVGLRDCPLVHEPAVTPAGNAETLGIDWVFLRDSVDASHAVTQIAVPKIFHIRAGELFSLTVTAARIGKKNVITA